MTLAIVALIRNTIRRADWNFLPLAVMVGLPFLILDGLILSAVVQHLT